MKYIEQSLAHIKHRPLEVFAGACVFCATMMGTSVKDVASTAAALLFIASLFAIRQWLPAWRQLARNEKLMLVCLGLYAMSGVVAVINVQDMDEYTKDIERYIRFALAVPVYLLIRIHGLALINYLYAGAVVSGPFLLLVALPGYLENPGLPAHGYYHHIIFGTVAMLNVGVMLAMLLTLKMNRLMKAIVLVAMLCGLLAAVLSQSRGVWLVLPLYLLLVLYYALGNSKAKLAGVILVFVIMGALLLATPVGDIVKNRVGDAVEEVAGFYTKDQYASSLGARLAMWEVAIDVWKRHPLVGTGPGDFDEIIMSLQKQGQYVGMEVHASTHNIYIQALVNAGALGLVALLLAIIIVPMKIYLQSIRRYPGLALTGVVFILLFATIGVSESWILRSPTVAVYILFLLTTVSGLYLAENNSHTAA